MKREERRDNEDQYLGDIGQAIRDLVERCGGSLETSEGPIPKELSIHQRDLYIHSGITGILSMAVMQQDRDMIDFFDYLLGYQVHKDRMGEGDRDKFVVALLTAFHEQIVKDSHAPLGQKFFTFLSLQKLSLLVLDGHLTSGEIDEAYSFCMHALNLGFARKADARRKEAERN